MKQPGITKPTQNPPSNAAPSYNNIGNTSNNYNISGQGIVAKPSSNISGMNMPNNFAKKPTFGSQQPRMGQGHNQYRPLAGIGQSITTNY
jgi:hypothetical protein